VACFRKRPPFVLEVVRGVIGIGSIEEAAARLSFSHHINGAKIQQAVGYGGLFEHEQISIDVTMTSLVYMATLRCAASYLGESAQ
jgi:hypothetical protein